MPSLSKDLRKQLERTTLKAREAAEKACRAALENLAVHEREYRGHMSIEQRQLRNRLRARGRALGDQLDLRTGQQEIKRLAEDAAYEHWHRILFTRFLSENGLLHTDEENGNVPVTLEECEELAPELDAKDGFDLACRFAQRILPGVFRTGDPVFELTLALNDQVELRSLLESLPREVFTADDSLGWTYQFWQTKRKKDVNKSGSKIGADEISPVTQLFTEDYMVEFLLHNTLGAWWAGKLGPIQAATEEEARAKASLPERDGISVIWTYLRFNQDEETKTWRPASGIFDGWPKEAKHITFLDPCMGSGHFPVFALPILARLRMEEENLSGKEAVYAVLQDNLHGLELDPRCCQIGAFNLALTAWKLSGFQTLPSLHIACCGIAPQAKLDDWVALAGEDERLSTGMERLYGLFQKASVLGSLINPRAGEDDLLVAAFHELQPLLEKALAMEAESHDVSAEALAKVEMAITAHGLAKAAEILAGQFTLVATNVPYLGRKKHDDVLKDYCERVYLDSKTDLATCFLERSLTICALNGSIALVTPQNWLSLGGYEELRQNLLSKSQWDFVARLGPKGFQTPMYDFNVLLIGLTNRASAASHSFSGFDVSGLRTPAEKDFAFQVQSIVRLNQKTQLANPDSRVSTSEMASDDAALGEHVECYQGVVTGDLERFRIQFWEVNHHTDIWRPFRTTTSRTGKYDGLDAALRWEGGKGQLHEYAALTRDQLHDMHESGNRAWNKIGVAINRMAELRVTSYLGEIFDNNVAVAIPKEPTHLPALIAFCSALEFHNLVRSLDQTLKVTNRTLVKVPFDLAHWQKVAAEKYPHGLPKPFSSDPTQWLFNGHPAGADQPLHVAVARLLGYQWPRQTGSSFPDCPALGPDGLEKLADDDGIVCLPPLNREQPAAARLRGFLAKALGNFDEKSLLASAGKKGSKSKTLEDWLSDEFFEQHCQLFNKRPFIWHIWDGRKDGFAALVNYHCLDQATLQKLTYSHLGDWIRQQESDAKADKPGAAERLGAARSLQAEFAKILEGEAPYDIFVRWKPLSQQPIGWHPDLNDGVRLNIRPFLMANDVDKKGAGILRSKPSSIKWTKDRGKEPIRDKAEYPWFWCSEEPNTDPTGEKEFIGNRWNDVHLTLDTKKTSRL